MSNILSVLENFSLDNADDIAISMAHDFRKRRLEILPLLANRSAKWNAALRV